MGRRARLTAAAVGLVVVAAARLGGRTRRYAIAESSMSPALNPGDWTVARRLLGTPARGAIVVFPHPADRDFELVKRVVGLPGEHVVIGNGQVAIDGGVLAEPWADGPTLPDGEWMLGDDELFVLGDRRAASSADSRLIGPIPAAVVGWQLRARYWPPTAARRL